MPTVLVTGANRGLGLEFARQYAADGWTVIATVREESAELSELGVEVSQLDMRDFDAIVRFGQGIDRLNLLIANAGTYGPRNPATAEDGDPVRPARRLGGPDTGGDPVEGVVPRDGRPLAGLPVAHQRRREPLATAVQPCRGPPLAAQRPAVDGELLPGRHLGCAPASPGSSTDAHPALQRAVWAVGLGLGLGLGLDLRLRHQISAAASPWARTGRRR